MSSESPRHPLVRRRSRWWSWIRWRWPVGVWIALTLLAIWLYNHGGEFLRINGMVEVISESVGPLESGYLKALRVLPGDRVESGQVVAEMDTTTIDQQIALLKESLRAGQAEDMRQFLTASQRIEEEMRSLQLDLAEARAESRIYRKELAQLEGLLEEGFASSSELVEPRARLAVLQERIELYPTFLTSLKRQLEELEQLRQETLGGDAGGQAKFTENQLQLLEQRRARHFLKAGQSGIVAEVRQQPGEVVERGEGIIEIITEQPPRILAFMNEADTRPIAVGHIVEVEPAIGGPRFPAEVVTISPNVLSLPDRASPIPNRVVRGRRLELVPLEAPQLAPGTSVVVLLPRQEMLWTSLFGGWKR